MRRQPAPHPYDLRAVDVIARKRDGLPLEPEELDWFISAYVAGAVAEEEMAAFLMAVYLRGMDADETAALTMAMAATGKPVDLSSLAGVKVDKHSTGGVGDKTTLVVAPLVAAAGASVTKMSGRALGHTGGTIDKLESIPGLSCEMTAARFVRQVRRIGLAVAAQSADMCPADQRMYALRNRIGAVASQPLIAASIMSKKLTAGADAIVLDVKCGGGAFTKDLRSARRLAQTMVEIGARAGRPTAALVSDMSQPLGCAVGEALEVGEALAVLRGEGPPDVRELSLALGGRMLVLALVATDEADARRRLESALAGGTAAAKLREMIEAQGGDHRVVDDPALLPRAERKVTVRAPAGGVVRAIDARAVGEMAQELVRDGGPGGGVVLLRKRGDRVRKGEALATACGGDDATLLAKALADAFAIGVRAPRRRPLVREAVGGDCPYVDCTRPEGDSPHSGTVPAMMPR
ncbi:MAG TPA: thymidine phosphorylase [Armatimonadota bacterium]|nr:thymidine phosphorylase [Armatimonadota bacterium]